MCSTKQILMAFLALAFLFLIQISAKISMWNHIFCHNQLQKHPFMYLLKQTANYAPCKKHIFVFCFVFHLFSNFALIGSNKWAKRVLLSVLIMHYALESTNINWQWAFSIVVCTSVLHILAPVERTSTTYIYNLHKNDFGWGDDENARFHKQNNRARLSTSNISSRQAKRWKKWMNTFNFF